MASSFGRAYICKSGRLAVIRVDPPSGPLVPITGVTSYPTIIKNGSPVELALMLYSTIKAGGSGYTASDVAHASDGAHSVTGVLTVSGGSVTGIQWRGYWSSNWGVPLVTFATAAGSGASVTAQANPIWTNVTQSWPHVLIPFVVPVLNADVLTFFWVAGGLTTSAGSTPLASDLPLANYTGMLESDFVPSSHTMGVGVNVSIFQGFNYNNYHSFGNWRLCSSDTWTCAAGAAQTNFDGSLATWTAGKTATSTFCNTVSANNIDGRLSPAPLGPTMTVGGPGTGAAIIPTIVNKQVTGYQVLHGGTGYVSLPTVTLSHGYGWGATVGTVHTDGNAITAVDAGSPGNGYCDGLWRLAYDDHTPIAPTVWELNSQSANITIVRLSVNPGTLISGIQTNIQKVYYASYVATPATWSPGLHVEVTGGLVSGGLATNGVQNVRIFPPGNPDSTADLWVANANTVGWLTTSLGNTPAVVRSMDGVLGPAGWSPIASKSDAMDPNTYRLGTNPPLTGSDLVAHPQRSRIVSIGEVRPYDLSVSPNVYIDAEWQDTIVADNTAIAPRMWVLGETIDPTSPLITALSSDLAYFLEDCDGGIGNSAVDLFTFTDLSASSHFFGRFRRGDTVRVNFTTPGKPDYAPVLVVVDANSVQVDSFSVPTTDPNKLIYTASIFVGYQYSLSNFTVYFHYVVNGVSGLQSGTFQVIAGGDSGGNVISLFGVDRPEARSLIAQLASGRLVVGANPRFQ